MENSVIAGDGPGVEALWTNFVRLGRDSMMTLVVPWLVIAFLDAVFVAIAVAIVVMTAGFEPGRGGLAWVQGVAVVQMIVIMGLRVALLKSLRDVAFRGPAGVPSFGAVGRDVLHRLLPSLGITAILVVAVAAGFMLCVFPGLIALFLLAFAPYLVAGKHLSVPEAIAESVRWARTEWSLLLSAMVVALLATGLLACMVGLFSGVGARPAVAVPAGLIGGWVANTVFGYIAFLWWGAVYVTAESREQLRTLRKTAPKEPKFQGPLPPSPAVYREGE